MIAHGEQRERSARDTHVPDLVRDVPQHRVARYLHWCGAVAGWCRGEQHTNFYGGAGGLPAACRHEPLVGPKADRGGWYALDERERDAAIERANTLVPRDVQRDRGEPARHVRVAAQQQPPARSV